MKSGHSIIIPGDCSSVLETCGLATLELKGGKTGSTGSNNNNLQWKKNKANRENICIPRGGKDFYFMVVNRTIHFLQRKLVKGSGSTLREQSPCRNGNLDDNKNGGARKIIKKNELHFVHAENNINRDFFQSGSFTQ